jgi:hypothetical protein
LVYFAAGFSRSGAFLDRRQVLSAYSVEGDADEPYLIEKVKVIDVIGSEDEAHKLGLDVVDIGLLEFSGLEVGIGIGIQ